MAQITEDGGSGGPRDLRLAAEELAEAIDEVGSEDGRCWVAVVTDASLQASSGLVYATIGSSEVQVIAWGARLAATDKIIVKKFDNSQSSPYVLIDYAAASAENAVEYGLSFGNGLSDPTGHVYAKWGGTVLAVEEYGTATFALTVGGVSKGVGDSIAAGSWISCAVSGAAADDVAVAVIVG